MGSTQRVNHYGALLDSATEALEATNDFLEILSNPSKKTAAHLQAAVGRLANFAAMGVFGTLGAILTAPVPPVGAAGGALFGKFLTDKLIKFGWNNAFHSHKLQPVRIQTRKMLTGLKQAGGNIVVNTAKGMADRNDLFKSAGAFVTSQATQALGAKVPVAPLTETFLDFKGSSLLTNEKRYKIENVLADIHSKLSDEVHEEIMQIFDDTNNSSFPDQGPLYLKSLLGFTHTKEGLTTKRDRMIWLFNGVVRMLHEPSIYKKGPHRDFTQSRLKSFNDEYIRQLKY